MKKTLTQQLAEAQEQIKSLTERQTESDKKHALAMAELGKSHHTAMDGIRAQLDRKIVEVRSLQRQLGDEKTMHAATLAALGLSLADCKDLNARLAIPAARNIHQE